MTERQIFSAYNRRPRQRLEIVGESRTKQSFKDECDINKIMAKFQKTGALTHFQKHAPNYGFATSVDFAEAMRIVTTGQGMFRDLPSSIRRKFGNDPAQFLEYVQDENNHEEMVELGLVEGPQATQSAEGDGKSPADKPAAEGGEGASETKPEGDGAQ